MTSLTKNLHNPTKQHFFECKLLDLPKSSELLTGSVVLTEQRNSHAKPCAIWLFLREPLELTQMPMC